MDSFSKVIEALLSIVMAVVTFFTSLFGGGKVTYEPLDAASLKLNAVLISDTHVTSSEADRQDILKAGLKDMAGSKAKTDVLLVDGDLTQDGLTEQYNLFYSLLKSGNKAKNTVVAMGNHDSWQYQNSINDFKSTYNSYTGSSITTPYYSKTVNGYSFLVLGTEKRMQNESYLSQAQLNWIDAQLTSIGKSSDKPVFILCHQPLNGTNSVDEAWSIGILGEQSDALMTILKKHTAAGMTLIFCSGHLHSGIGYSGVTHDGKLYFVDCPSYGKMPSRGVKQTGTGYVVEAYQGKVVLRARNFSTGQFLTGYEYTIPTSEKMPEPETTTSPVTEPTTQPPEPTTQPITNPTKPIDIG